MPTAQRPPLASLVPSSFISPWHSGSPQLQITAHYSHNVCSSAHRRLPSAWHTRSTAVTEMAEVVGDGRVVWAARSEYVPPEGSVSSLTLDPSPSRDGPMLRQPASEFQLWARGGNSGAQSAGYIRPDMRGQANNAHYTVQESAFRVLCP
uniref:Uncharacterized protein n=1 Tax=Knipowitschia caucasica TaxID=637954 RepID=A0AAV2LTX2_KNICA